MSVSITELKERCTEQSKELQAINDVLSESVLVREDESRKSVKKWIRAKGSLSSPGPDARKSGKWHWHFSGKPSIQTVNLVTKGEMFSLNDVLDGTPFEWYVVHCE